MTDCTGLEALAQLADESEAEGIAEEARALAARAAEGRFYVACVGQFKRGKSTLINALVGAPVLPTGVAPVTAIPTVLRFGEPGARVKLANGSWIPLECPELVQWVTEAGNPSNRKRVAGIEVFAPSPLLATGLCLVDTPGLGSVFGASTRATHDFIPEIDAAVVVLGVDPPISGGELDLIVTVAAQVEHLVFVLNKVDRFGADELREARLFTERTVSRRLTRPMGSLFEISSLAASRGETSSGDWHELVRSLERLATGSGGALVAAAVKRGRERLACRLDRVLLEERAALVRPVEESAVRLRELDALAAEADRMLADLTPLLALDQQRVSLSFGTREDEFLARALPAARTRLSERLVASAPPGARLRRRRALDVANEVARGLLQPWLADSEQAADAAYRDAVRRFILQAQQLLVRLATASADPLTAIGLDSANLDVFSGKRSFYFTDLLHRHLPAAPWVWIADALVPRSLGRRRIEVAAEAYVVDLLRVNAARVRADLDDRLGQSRHRLEAGLRIVLHEGREAATRALDRARAARAAGQAAVERELAAIDDRRVRLQDSQREVAAVAIQE